MIVLLLKQKQLLQSNSVEVDKKAGPCVRFFYFYYSQHNSISPDLLRNKYGGVYYSVLNKWRILIVYRIGELARLAGVTQDTIRFYEKQGIMVHVERTKAGYRLYKKQDLQCLRFIRHAKQLGFSLESIRELLSIRIDPEHHTCRESKSIVEARLFEVEAKLKELEHMRNSLQCLSDACCGNAHDSTYCSILEALEQDSSR